MLHGKISRMFSRHVVMFYVQMFSQVMMVDQKVRMCYMYTFSVTSPKCQQSISKGCGIVEYADHRDAARAVAALTDTELNGRKIFVREDREAGSYSMYCLCLIFVLNVNTFSFVRFSLPCHQPISGKPTPVNMGGLEFRGSSGINKSYGTTKLYVGNLSYEVKWQDLKDHFKQCGHVSRADILEGSDGRSKGCGLIEYADARDAATAIYTLNDTELNGRKIFVREDREVEVTLSLSLI